MSENNMSEKNMPEETSGTSNKNNGGLDTALAQMVTTYTDDAPAAPDINRILTERAARPRASAGRWSSSSWLRPAVAGVFGLAVIGGGAYALVAAGQSNDGGQIVVPADPGEDDDQVTPTIVPSESADTADGEGGDGETGDADVDAEAQAGDADTGTSTEILAGAESAGDLPEAAPDTYWAIRLETYDLVQVESRTGRILANLGGWGQQSSDAGEGELLQALASVEAAADGTLFVDDCCEPAYGTIFRLSDGEAFDSASGARRTGVDPSLSPSGALLMYSVGGSLVIVDVADKADGALTLAELGDIEPTDGVRFTPLTWLDDETIAVRIFGGEREEIRIYEFDGAALTERVAARRTIADRFHMDAATRADGMLVVAGRRPNGDPLGLAGGGDLVADVIDPETGELISEFDLPDQIFDIDYDSAGNYLLTSGDNGVVEWFGAGQSGVLATGVVYASWN